MSNLEVGPCSGLEYEVGEHSRLKEPDLTRELELNPDSIYTWVVKFKEGGAYKQPVNLLDVCRLDEESGLYVAELDLLDEDGDPDVISYGVYEDGYYVEEEDGTVTVIFDEGVENIVDTGYLRLPKESIGPDDGEETEGVNIEGVLSDLNDYANGKEVKEPKRSPIVALLENMPDIPPHYFGKPPQH